jgi:glutathionylspermidine synthase
MLSLKKISPLNTQKLQDIGFTWHTDDDGSNYIADELLEITHEEAMGYYNAVNELYDMFVEAAEYVIENDLFFELGIPFNLVDIIKKSWENDVHWHIYGRFDLAGGIDGKPIKLIEFNADTPTMLFETAVLQWAMLKENNLDEAKQFNNVYEAITNNFKRLITLFDDVELFKKYYEGWKILFSSVEGLDEDEATTRLLQQMATDAGFTTEFEFIHNVKFDNEGIYDINDNPFEYWFKLYPWEDIAIEEGELATTLTNIINNQKAIVLNPAYTLLFQSKGILKILYDLFPNSPYLLKTSFEPLNGVKQVSKPVFGREGENISILDENGDTIESTNGDYDNYKKVYQEYVELAQDKNSNYYQAGVFFAYEGCGVGFRRGNKILDNDSKFIGHIIK